MTVEKLMVGCLRKKREEKRKILLSEKIIRIILIFLLGLSQRQVK